MSLLTHRFKLSATACSVIVLRADLARTARF
jgi:hypothetical protein